MKSMHSNEPGLIAIICSPTLSKPFLIIQQSLFCRKMKPFFAFSFIFHLSAPKRFQEYIRTVPGGSRNEFSDSTATASAVVFLTDSHSLFADCTSAFFPADDRSRHNKQPPYHMRLQMTSHIRPFLSKWHTSAGSPLLLPPGRRSSGHSATADFTLAGCEGRTFPGAKAHSFSFPVIIPARRRDVVCQGRSRCAGLVPL